MGIIDNLTGIFRQKAETPRYEAKEAPQVVLQTTYGTHKRSDKYESYAKEGYQYNAIVFRCVNEIANGAAAIPFKVFQGEIELERHPLISLLERPNPLQAGVEYFQALYSYLLLSGNSFAIRNDVGGTPRELHLLRPDRIRIKPSKTSIPEGYEYVLGGQVAKYYPSDPMTGLSEVKHFKFFNPLDDYLGMSPLMAAAIDIDQHNAIANHNISLLNNGARPTGAIVFKPQNDRGIPMQLSDSQRQQLNEDLRNRFTGPNNSGRPVLLEGDFDWKEMGLSPRDMDFLQNKNMAAKDIALCFGVPSQLIGVPDAQTYANVQEARLALYEETIIPLAKRVESDLNEWLAPLYGDDFYIQYDIDAVPAMTERRRRVYENVTQAVREGIISRNEARERLGLEPISGGDEVYIAANLFPLGAPDVAQDEGISPDDAGKLAYGETETKEEHDVYETEAEAEERAAELGCEGYHEAEGPDGVYYMPCGSHAEWVRATGNDKAEGGEDAKAESDVDTRPTREMARNAEQGLRLRKEFNRGGTEVGVARAVQLINRERLSPRTVRRMHSFFARHEVDERAEGFRRGEPGFPSAGFIAHQLWGGTEGRQWSARKVEELDKARGKEMDILDIMVPCCDDCDALSYGEVKADVSESIAKALSEKVKEHNDKHGDAKSKRVTQRMLEAVFTRGVGAYRTNPESVRPNVTGPDQWGLARVNAFLFAVRTGRFKGGKFDTDLLPEGHPMRTGK